VFFTVIIRRADTFLSLCTTLQMFQAMKQYVAVQHQQHNYLWKEIKIIKQKLTATRLITLGGGGGHKRKKPQWEW
jgi:hypothetical protein